MTDEGIVFRPIGIIHSGHEDPAKTPVQPVYAKACSGIAEIFPEHADGLKDIEGFSHLYILYHLHRSEPGKLIVKPFLQDRERGVFATRSPARPNAIGLSVVELVLRQNSILHLRGVDILDGTPILDIKPYSARFDHIQAIRSGWLDEVDDDIAKLKGMRRYKS